MKYKQLITPKKEEEVQEQELDFKTRQAQLQLKADILSTEKQLSSLKNQLQLQKAASPFDSQAVVTLMAQVRNQENALSDLAALETELF